MGKQVKGWTPPQDAVEMAVVKDDVQEDPKKKWTPPADAVPVKKKDDTPSTDGSVSSKPAAPVTEPSAPSTEKKPESPKQKFDTRVENLISTTQNQFNTEAEKKRAEFQQIVDRDPTQADAVNKQFQDYLTGKETEYNQLLDKWVTTYAKDFEREDFQQNKETNPAKSFGKMAWTTLRRDIPSQFYSAKALSESAMKKMEDELMDGITPLAKDDASTIETFFDKSMKSIFGVTDEQLKSNPIKIEGSTELILSDLRKSMEQSKLSAEQKKYLVNNLDKVKDGDFVDWMNYAASAVGQGVGQIPLSVGTRGASSIMQQVGSIYLDSVMKIAEDEGISPEEVIKQGKDDVVYPLLFGVGTGMLDAIGARGVLGAATKGAVMDSFRKRGLAILTATGIESATETVQTGLEDIGINQARGKSWHQTLKDFNWKPLKDAALQGGIAGLFLAGAGQTTQSLFDATRKKIQPTVKKPLDTVITEKVVTTNTEDITQVDAAAKEIQQAIDNPTPDATAIDPALQKPITANEPTQESTEQQRQDAVDTQQPDAEGVPASAVSISPDDGGRNDRGSETVSTPTDTGSATVDQQPTGTEVQEAIANLREQILNSPEDLKVDGKKVTILTQKGADMVNEYQRLKDEAKARDNTGTDSGGQVDANVLLAPTEETQSREGTAAAQQTIEEDETNEGQQAQGRQDQVLGTDLEQQGPINQQASGTPAVAQTSLTEQIQTGKSKPSTYYSRMVDDDTLGDAIKNQDATYQAQSLKKAIKVSDDLVAEAVANNDVDTLFKETTENFNKIPPLMQVNLAEKLMDYYAKRFDDTKLKTLYNLIGAEAAAERGRSVAAYNTGRGEPQRVIGSILSTHAENKTKVMTPEVEQKMKSLHEELRVKTEELEQVKKKLAEKISEVEKKLSNSDKGLKERISQRKQKVESAKTKLSSLKIKTDGQANSITNVIGAAAFNAAIDTINVSLDAGLSLTNAIDKAITTVRQHYKGDWDPEAFRAHVETSLKDEADGLSVDAKDLVKKGLSGLGLKINEIVDSHYKDVQNVGKKISDRFITELGLDEATAKSLETDIQSALNSIVKERQTKLLSERLGSEKLPKKAAKKKELFDQIIADINRGALTDDLFTELFADYYGFEPINAEQRKMLLDYADRLQKVSQYPEIYNRVANQFWNDLKKSGLDKNKSSDVFLDFLYHGALSGFTTQSRSLKGSTMTNIATVIATSIASPKAAPAAWAQWFKGIPGGLKTAMDVMSTGYRADQYNEFRPKGDSYITQKMQTPITTLMKDNDWAGVYTKIAWTMPGYMLRALSAWDAILKSGNLRFHGYMIEYNQMGNPAATEAGSLYSKATTDAITSQAKADAEYLTSIGEKLPSGYQERRVEELREKKMDETVAKRIYQRSSEGVLMSDPHGMAGNFYRWLTNNLAVKDTDSKMTVLGKMFGRTVFLIARVPANFINMNIDYSPLGYWRAIRGNLQYRDGVYRMTPEERRIQFIKATAGTAIAATATMMLFDWDDEEGMVLDPKAPVRIYGPGMDKWADNESIVPGFKPWSVQFKTPDGKWSDLYSFIDNPFGAVLAPLAMASDEVRFREFRKKTQGKEDEILDHNMQFYGSLVANGTVGFLISQSYQQGIKDTRDILLPYGNDYSRSMEKLEKLAIRPVKTLTLPNVYQQIYNYSKAGVAEPEKYSKSVLEKLAKGTPIIESVMLQDDVDMFGYPMIKRFDVPLIPDVILELAKDNIDYREDIKEWRLVHKYPEVIVKPFMPPRSINNKKWDDENTVEFKKLAGDELSRLVKDELTHLNRLPPDKLQVKLDLLRGYAYDRAKARIVMNKKL